MKATRAAFDDCADIDDDLSDEEDISADLVKEIDEMKARLMRAMQANNNVVNENGVAPTSADVNDSSMISSTENRSLSQHTLSSSSRSRGQSASAGGASDSSSLSYHELDTASSKMSDNDVYAKLKSVLGNGTTTNFSDDDESEYETLSEGNLSSLGSDDNYKDN